MITNNLKKQMTQLPYPITKSLNNPHFFSFKTLACVRMLQMYNINTYSDLSTAYKHVLIPSYVV